MATIGGKRAARIGARVAQSHDPDSIYERAAAILGLYGIAFFGHRGTRNDRRQLRAAWAESRHIAALYGYWTAR